MYALCLLAKRGYLFPSSASYQMMSTSGRRDTAQQWQHPAVPDASDAIGCSCSECLANRYYNEQTLRTMRTWLPNVNLPKFTSPSPSYRSLKGANVQVQYSNGNSGSNAPVVSHSPFNTSLAHDGSPFIPQPQVPVSAHRSPLCLANVEFSSSGIRSTLVTHLFTSHQAISKPMPVRDMIAPPGSLIYLVGSRMSHGLLRLHITLIP